MPAERPEIIKFIKSVYLFKKLDDAKVDLLADTFETGEYEPGQMIYTQGDGAEKLYFVLRGKVRLFRCRVEDEEESLGLFEVGDPFGFEMLEYETLNQTSARAESEVVLLCLSREKIRTLLETIDTLNLDIKILYDSYLLNLRHRWSWRNEDEVVYYISRSHSLYFLLKLIPILVIGVIVVPIIVFIAVQLAPLGMLTPYLLVGGTLAVFLGWGVWVYADWANDYAIITNQRVAYIEKVILLYDSRTEAPLNAVLSVTTDTDYWGRLLKYGNIVIRTFAGTVKFPRMANPKQVAAYLGVQRDRVSKKRIETEQHELEDAIRSRLGMKAVALQGKTQIKGTGAKEPGIFSRLKKAFQQRIETKESITWRTHWIFLLKTVLAPSSLILGMLVVIVFAFLNKIPFLPPLSVIALALMLMLIGVGWWTYTFLDWSNDIYILTADQVLDINHKPLSTEERRSAPLKNVQSVEFGRRGIIGLFLNYGTILIKVGDSELIFENVPNPADVQRELFKRLALRDYREKHAELEAEQKRVADWIAAYHRVVEAERQKQNTFTSKPDSR